MQQEFVDDEIVMARSMADWAQLILKRLRSSDDSAFLEAHGPAIEQIDKDVARIGEQILWQEHDAAMILWRMQRLLVNLFYVSLSLGGQKDERPILSGEDRIKPALAAKEKSRFAFECAVWAAMNRDGNNNLSALRMARRIMTDVKDQLSASTDSVTRAYPVSERSIQDAVYSFRSGKKNLQKLL